MTKLLKSGLLTLSLAAALCGVSCTDGGLPWDSAGAPTVTDKSFVIPETDAADGEDLAFDDEAEEPIELADVDTEDADLAELLATRCAEGCPASEKTTPFAKISVTPIRAGDTLISADDMWTETGKAKSEWNSVKTNPKVKALFDFAQTQLHGTLAACPKYGHTTTVLVRYERGPTATSLAVREILVPLCAKGTTTPLGASAVFVIGKYVDTPGLVVPRLLIRFDPNNWHVEEYALRRDGKVTQMAARFGDCLFRSSLKMLEASNTPVHTSLRAALNDTAHQGTHLNKGMRAVLDLREPPVGQPELALTMAVMTAANTEEEYDAGYISGTLDSSFKPQAQDSWWVQQAKNLAKQVMKEIVKLAGQTLWDAIASIFGF